MKKAKAPRGMVIVVCTLVILIVLMVANLLSPGEETMDANQPISNGFRETAVDFEVKEIPLPTEPYKVALDDRTLYYLGEQIEDTDNAKVEYTALYSINNDEDRGKYEEAIIDIKPSKITEKDNIAVTEDEENRKLIVWEWFDDKANAVTKTAYTYSEEELWRKCVIAQEGDSFLFWGGDLYWFAQQKEKIVLLSQDREKKEATNIVAKHLSMPNADVCIENGYLALLQGDRKQIVGLDLKTQSIVDKITVKGFVPESVQGNERYIVSTDQDGVTYLYEIASGKTYHLGKASYAKDKFFVFLRQDKVWMIEHSKAVMYNLTDFTKSTVALTDMTYTDFSANREGNLLGCSMQERKCILFAEKAEEA